MVSNLKCPECKKFEDLASEYGEMLDERDYQLAEAVMVLKELYGFSKSCIKSGEKMWCNCESCNKLEEKIKKILEYWR